ncbi:hypothetical protein GX50_02709 [[Emmonsia] crescens]|uniref:HNH nuclease domain-containing protein n=1 Tax=[Emmonsia] crescens TaxID=73230 RepID=A0A2B7ZM70_9EURO|nr:hypothetical protein GX50_02709 [Emmonsia crescens]
MKFLASSALPSSLSPPPVDDQLARRRLELNAPKTEDDSTVRALASFLDFLPNEGRHPLSQFVSGCSNATLYSLAEYLISSILIPIRTRAITPEFSPSPFEDNGAQVQEEASSMDQPPTRNKQKQLKQQCLDRDDHRCMATGISDVKADGIGTVRLGFTAHTVLAHIIPYSIGTSEDKKTDHKVAQMWATVKRLFPRIELGLILLPEIRNAFDRFGIAFEPIENNHEYQNLTLGPEFLTIFTLYLPPPTDHGYRLVTFQAHTNTPLPSPAILQAHATLANILHASGIGEHIENIMREFEETRYLAPDGSDDIYRLISIRLRA